jgi:hypothetical protein
LCHGEHRTAAILQGQAQYGTRAEASLGIDCLVETRVGVGIVDSHHLARHCRSARDAARQRNAHVFYFRHVLRGAQRELLALAARSP